MFTIRSHLTNVSVLGIGGVYTFYIFTLLTLFTFGQRPSVWTLFTCSEGQQILLSSICCCFVRHDCRLLGWFLSSINRTRWSTLWTDMNLKLALIVKSGDVSWEPEIWTLELCSFTHLHICLTAHFTHLFVPVVRAGSSTRTLKLFCSNQGDSFCCIQFCRAAVNKEHIWRVTKLDTWGVVGAFLTQRVISGSAYARALWLNKWTENNFLQGLE